jgi:hypothetical protein
MAGRKWFRQVIGSDRQVQAEKGRDGQRQTKTVGDWQIQSEAGRDNQIQLYAFRGIQKRQI